MLRLKKICALFLAAGVITARGVPVLAAEDLTTETSVPADEVEKYGNTTISIFQARQDPKNVSFTVPLYVTMAVVEGEPLVQTPTNYAITNTSKTGVVNTAPPFDIAVVNMEFTKMAGSSYNTVEDESDFTDSGRDIVFHIGHLTMPALSEPGTRPVTLRSPGSQFLASPSEAEYASSPLKNIEAEPGTAPDDKRNVLTLELKGTVPATLRLNDAPSAAQFQVKYILSVLDNAGEPLGNVYAGDDGSVAGLKEFAP